ncbi:MAG: PBP1A family penicillin-binding protein [bacterium]|nr:PBP1A family penicillin-binding protein [bacterium]
MGKDFAQRNPPRYLQRTSGTWRHRHPWFRRMLIICLVLIGLILVSGVVFAITAPAVFKTPDLDALMQYQPFQVTKIYSDTNELVGELAIENRIRIPLSKIPKNLQNAVIAVEDKNFYKHHGIDYSGLVRAAWRNLLAGKVVQGGSTIPQQLAKILYTGRERTIKRKIKDAVLAMQISKKYSKEQILEIYLNQIYFGHGAYGVEAAANLYFGKSATQLNLAECALLAGLIRAPEYYSPFRNLDRAKKRRNYVISRMLEEGYITKNLATRAQLSAIILSKRRERFTAAAYFTEQVRRELESDPNYGTNAIYKEGLRVYTTMNMQMQLAAQELIKLHLQRIEQEQQELRNLAGKSKKTALKLNQTGLVKIVRLSEPIDLKTRKFPKSVIVDALGKQVTLKLPEELPWLAPENILKPANYLLVKLVSVDAKGDPVLVLVEEPHVQAALIAIDPQTGGIKAMVGGYDFNESQFNRAIQAYRQPGSAFKPIVYAAALDNGYVPSDIITDAPISFTFGNKTWAPKNYDGKYRGAVTLRYALEHSLNAATVRLGSKIGIDTILEYAHRLGIPDTEDRTLNRDLSLVLGSCDVMPIELVSVYAIFCNGGTWYQPNIFRSIADHSGRVIEEFTIQSKEVISPQTCYLITDMMKGVIKRGTAAYYVGSKFNRPAAGKTGTSSDYSDAWFIGYTPNLVVGVWVGYDKRAPLGHAMTGGRCAGPIWRDFMLRVLEGTEVTDFPVPPGIVFVDLCSATGKKATARCKEASDLDGGKTFYIYREAFKEGTEPREYCDSEHTGLTPISTGEIDAEAPPTDAP